LFFEKFFPLKKPLSVKRAGEEFFTKTEQRKRWLKGILRKSIPFGLVLASAARGSFLSRKQ
jgi:hypothetical protein